MIHRRIQEAAVAKVLVLYYFSVMRQLGVWQNGR
jgi:hypothetical protein